jgi:hypothetical protein
MTGKAPRRDMYRRIYAFRKGRTIYYRDDFLLFGFLLIFRIQKEDIVP